MPTDLAEILGAEYQRGGRGPRFDCLGVVLLGVSILGLEPLDPWATLRSAWLSGEDRLATAADGFPPGWTRLQDLPVVVPPAGTVLLRADQAIDGDAPATRVVDHVDIVWRDGRVYSAAPGPGVFAQQWQHVRPLVVEAWRRPQ